MRTSVSHPLQIAAVVSGLHGFGRVGVTFCPGKYDPFGMTGRWNRDLDAIRDCGAAAAVTLLEPDELTLLRVERLGVELEMMSGFGLDVRLVSFGTPSRAILQMAEDFGS
jgi:ADP-ribosyl-[dinitrogen reductase] hydrolase